jgi:HD-GYP domain-containing protein (c-di-GMP phosphodiesterase class II)
LPEQQCRDIALAGLLHDLGMLALPRNLWLKPGRFTDEEYREMSQHAELGAALVEAVAANAAAASYIRHHHEHWDGSGYPQALQGEQIPLGSRVIAVSEVFIAKLSGRQYRSPLPFARALQDLQQAGGKKLDPSVVGALTHWYEKKRLSVATSEQSLAPCWVMRCCPADICSRCPAYRQTERNCWDFSGVNCSLHGNTCATCLIYTEHLGRPQPQMR